MSSGLPVSPFETRRRIGTVCEVGPTYAKINLPDAAAAVGSRDLGAHFGAGEVGEFVCFECGACTVLGRITNIRLPESDRLEVEAKLGKAARVNPLGHVQLLTSIDLRTGKVAGGIVDHPRLGGFVYSAPPRIITHIAERFASSEQGPPSVVLDIGTLPGANDLPVRVTPERLFGRHCGILGSTGGGKSFTLARIMEQSAGFVGRSILLDATGEFHTLGPLAEHVYLGSPPVVPANTAKVVFPYDQLTEMDLIALFAPSGKVQGPKLREAIRSLRLARLVPALAPNGFIRKEGMLRQTFEQAMMQHASAVTAPNAAFDIAKLPEQIEAECIWPTERMNAAKFGGDNGERAYCVSLVTRINAMIRSTALAPIFQPGNDTSLVATITSFLAASEKRILRISLEHLQFDYGAREIIANAIGRDLLVRARRGAFLSQPLVIFVDEAHQFLNRSLGDEDATHRLDAFEIIAKEGRKYWLNICMATQRPRDIPAGVLSQMGTLIVHRLINDQDREVVERAAGEIDRSAAAFLPTLAPGEAAIVGVDFPIPLTVQVQKPSPQHCPQSAGPDYQLSWDPASILF
jgi:hypothetical protein